MLHGTPLKCLLTGGLVWPVWSPSQGSHKPPPPVMSIPVRYSHEQLTALGSAKQRDHTYWKYRNAVTVGQRSKMMQTRGTGVSHWQNVTSLYPYDEPWQSHLTRDLRGPQAWASGSWQMNEPSLLTDFRQALEANICLTREGRHITPGLSLSMKISSSTSWGPKVQFLLVGKEINLALSVTGAKRIKFGERVIIWKMCFIWVLLVTNIWKRG